MDEGAEGRRRVMGVGLGGYGYVGDRAMADEGVGAEAAGNYCGVCDRDTCIKDVHRGGEYGGIQQVPK